MWGANPDSRLMFEKSQDVSQPSLTLMSQLRSEDPEMFTAVSLALGDTHSAVITSSGEMFTAGAKKDGQLGCDLADSEVAEPENCQNFDSELHSPLSQVLPFGDDNAPKAIKVV